MGWFVGIEILSQDLGIPLDILKITIGFILILLLSPLYRLLPSKISRNYLSIVVGVLLLFFIIEEWSFFVLMGIFVPYYLIHSFPQPFLISVVWASLLLIIVHSHRFIVSYVEWKVDCSVYIMFLTTKLTYYGKWFQNLKEKKDANLLDYIGYNLFFPSLLAGPTFSYQTFLDYINQPKKTTFSSLQPLKALQPLSFGAVTAFVAIYFMPTFSTTWVVENQFYLESSILMKVLIMIPLGFFYRTKYYAAWYISQAAVNLSGLSESAEGSYDKVNAVSIKFQIEQNPKLKTEYWNSGIQIWLKDLVYDSLVGKVSSNLALFLTFFVSACWHGFYLTYYVCFAEWAVLNHITKWCYKWSLALPKEVSESKFFTGLTWFSSCAVMNTIGMVGLILQWNAVVTFYSDLYFSPVIILGTMLVLSSIIKPPSGRKEVKKE